MTRLFSRVTPGISHPGCEDPMQILQNCIEFSGVNLFSGFRGSGKTTELFRLKQSLQNSGHVVMYADALEYVNPAVPIDISDLLITLAGAFSDALEARGWWKPAESYWTRFWNFLTKTEVSVKELGLKAEAGHDPVKAGVDLKLELRAAPTLRQKIANALSVRLVELHQEVTHFFEDGFKAIRANAGDDADVVFLFDSLEQIRGSLSNEQEVTHSVELLFSIHLNLLRIPYIHMVYTVPPWLKFILPGTKMQVLPCVRLWEKGNVRPACDGGVASFRSLLEKRFSTQGLQRFFGPDPFRRAQRLIDLSGGHFRDLLLLLRETVVRADSLPVSDEAIDHAIMSVRSSFLPISLRDAEWLAKIEKEQTTVLETTEAADVQRLTRFLDTHIVLYLRNGEEWYDVHPLVREEVIRIASGAAAAQTT